MKKIPFRKCILTREILPKKELIRIVVNKKKDVFIDESQKAQGRGYYIKKDPKLIKKVVDKKILDKILKLKIEKQIYEKLEKILD